MAAEVMETGEEEAGAGVAIHIRFHEGEAIGAAEETEAAVVTGAVAATMAAAADLNKRSSRMQGAMADAVAAPGDSAFLLPRRWKAPRIRGQQPWWNKARRGALRALTNRRG